MRVPRSLLLGGIGLYLLWLIAVVLVMLGQYTELSTPPWAHTGTVLGAAALTVVGAVKLARDGYRRVTE
ncbi:hypothetical protein [Salinigranum sp. GCM10025319]|uniref:hypothetical protein n=1 Tax=Salinigranum sp. GCM10025319 TaxID=3252687 RepID=UPI0036126D06